MQSGRGNHVGQAKRAPTTRVQSVPAHDRITERKAALFDTLIAATGQLVWTMTKEGATVEDCPVWRAFTGQTATEFLGFGWRDAIHPEDRERLAHLIDELVVSERATCETECQLRHADGLYHTAHVRCMVVRGNDDAVRELLCVATDITERKRRNQERLRLLAFMDAITTSLGEGLYSVGLDGRLTFMNPAAERLLGWSETELLGKDMHSFTHYTEGGASGPGLIRCQLLEVMRTGETYRADEMFVRRDGTLAPVSVVSTPIFSNGRVSGGVVAFNDNTERYQLEEDLRLAAQAAAARASEHEAVFEALGDGIVVYDREGRAIHSNHAARQWRVTVSGEWDMASLSRDERFGLISICDERGIPIPPDMAPLARALRGEYLAGNKSIDVIIRAEGQDDLWLQVSAAPIRDQQGDVTGAVLIYHSLSERRRLEREVAARAREFETILESMTEGISVYHADGALAYMNPAGRRMLAFDALPDFFERTPTERDQLLDARDERGRPIPPSEWVWTRILSGEREVNAPPIDMWIRNLRGEDLIISFNGVPMRDADGAITGALLVYRDVTEQRRLEREVAARANLLTAVFEAMTDGVVVHGVDGSYLQHNRASRVLLGLDDDDRFMDMRDLAGKVEVRDANGQPLGFAEWPISHLLAGERLESGSASDLTLHRADGSEARVNITGAPIRDAGGSIVGAVTVTRDVTERRRLEQRTQDTLAMLLEMAEIVVKPASASDDLNVSAVQSIALRLMELVQRVIGCDYAGMLRLDESERLEPIAISGHTPDMTIYWENKLHGAPLRSLLSSAQQKAFHQGTAVSIHLDTQQYELPIGETEHTVLLVPLQSVAATIGLIGLSYRGERGPFTAREVALGHAVARLSGLAIEREQLQQERAEARASELAQRELVGRQDEFLSVASHELKTPLTSIKANVQLAQAFLTGNATDDAKAALARADQQMLRIERLVSELLDLSRIHVNRLALRREQRDLRAIVREAVEEQALLWPLRPLNMTLPDQSAPVWVDGDRIAQVVTNFLTNALKYSSEPSPVETILRIQGESAWVGVRDRGPGLPPEEHARVWERFRRVQGIEVAAGSDVGLGIGLYISKTIVEAHGGQVGVESAAGEGSTFWFSLPLAERRDSVSAPSSASAPA